MKNVKNVSGIRVTEVGADFIGINYKDKSYTIAYTSAIDAMIIMRDRDQEDLESSYTYINYFHDGYSPYTNRFSDNLLIYAKEYIDNALYEDAINTAISTMHNICTQHYIDDFNNDRLYATEQKVYKALTTFKNLALSHNITLNEDTVTKVLEDVNSLDTCLYSASICAKLEHIYDTIKVIDRLTELL